MGTYNQVDAMLIDGSLHNTEIIRNRWSNKGYEPMKEQMNKQCIQTNKGRRNKRNIQTNQEMEEQTKHTNQLRNGWMNEAYKPTKKGINKQSIRTSEGTDKQTN